MDNEAMPAEDKILGIFNRGVCAPILSLFCLSLAGLLLHLRIHPPSASAFNCVPAVSLVITTFILPFLFNFKATVKWAYLINAAAVVTGAVTMAYYSAFITDWGDAPLTLKRIILESTLADIIALCAKLPLGHIILRYFYPKPSEGT